MQATIGERLKAIEPYLGDDEVFLATYGDGLSDVRIPDLVSTFEGSGRLVMFALVRPHFHAHLVEADSDGTVRNVRAMNVSGVRINGGFFVMRREALDWIEPGDEFVEETFEKLIPRGEVGVFVHDGFFGPMDTIKDRQWLEGLLASRDARPGSPSGRRPTALSRDATARLAPGLSRSASVLAIGAHSDDIEIGCGGTVLSLARSWPETRVHWLVLAAHGDRIDEARASAEAFLAGLREPTVEILSRRDGYMPYEASEVKDTFEALKARIGPDLVLTHTRDDLHQDHRLVCDLTWNTFRDHLVLEYEIPKYDGDLGRPNTYVALDDDVVARKLELLDAHFGSQRSKDWFDDGVFRGLMRLRGMECRSPSGYAEAFTVRKLSIRVGGSRPMGL